MSGFYVGIAVCGCERAWLIDDDETTPKEIAEFARRQQKMKRTMKHVEKMNLETAPECTVHDQEGRER